MGMLWQELLRNVTFYNTRKTGLLQGIAQGCQICPSIKFGQDAILQALSRLQCCGITIAVLLFPCLPALLKVSLNLARVTRLLSLISMIGKP